MGHVLLALRFDDGGRVAARLRFRDAVQCLRCAEGSFGICRFFRGALSHSPEVWFIDALFSLCHVAWAKFIAEDDIRQIIISMWLTPSALSDIGSVHALRKDVYRDTAQE